MLTKTFANNDVFLGRRQRLNEVADEAVFVFFSGEEGHLSLFRAESSFVYLSGFEEPEACLVVRTGQNFQSTLFVRDRDPSVEIWDGERFGPQRAQTDFQMDQCFPITQLAQKLSDLFVGAKSLYFSLGQDLDKDKIILAARKKAQQANRRSGQAQMPILDPNQVLAPMRMVKNELEQSLMRQACELSAKAHLHVMKNVKPGMNERQVQADLFYSFYQQQASREGYSSIIASGVNATTLHYRANNRDMLDGEFLLIDAGAEKSYYTADITRTYPVNGKFTPIQKELYQSVLDVQKKLIQMVQPGFSLPELQEKACILLTEKMVELGLLSGKVTGLIEQKKYQKYYPHGVGHYLGLDVHDLGITKTDDQPVPFDPGMVITVEPGLYIPEDDQEAPKELRGLGVRIEDDILIGSKDPENMTSLAVKEISELEDLIGSEV